MASTATSRLRLNKQGTYDNPETWGIELNNGMIDMVDEVVGGFSATISGDVSLTVENYTADQARKMFMILDGAGGFTITVPAVDKMYYVVNNCAADVTVKPLAGTGAVIRAGMALWWYCDGTNGFVFDPTLDQILPPAADLDLNANKLINVGAPVDPDDAATKGYIDDLAALSDLGTVAAIAPQIVTVAYIQDGTVATDAVTDVAAVAGDIVLLAPKADDISQLAGMFTGASASDPTTRLDGSPLQAGDYYLNTSGTPTVRIYSGSAWIPIEAVAIASQGEAEAGSNNTKMMTPLRGAQQIAAMAGGYQEYTTSGMWAKPANANWVYVELIGGGGGGGSGRRAGASSAKSGGGGGGGSALRYKWMIASELSSSVSVTVGAGGTGGTGIATDSSLGNAGADGGTSSFGSYLSSLGGNGGGGGGGGVTGGGGASWGGTGTVSAKDSGFAGTAGGTTDVDKSTVWGGAAGGGGGGAAAFNGSSSVLAGSGGGAGGGETSANALFAPAAGGLGDSHTYGGGGAAGTSNTSAPTNGGNGSTFGTGGGGGGSSTTAAAGNGGNGGIGAGGGGGGASRNSYTSGAGGDGGAGFVRVWWGV